MNKLAYILKLAWRSIRSRWVQSLATVIVVGMALALFVAVAVLGDGVREGIRQAADPFGTLVIGPKGDSQQLVLSTILLNGNPLGTIDIEIFEQLETDERAKLVIPMAMADNVGGARVIGTTTSFFELQPSLLEASPFQLASGRYFEDLELHADKGGHNGHDDGLIEAVLGSTAAVGLGLKVGDLFVTSHGTEAIFNEDVHVTEHEVVGILQSTNTAFDSGIFVPLAGVWDTHADIRVNPNLAAIEDSATDVGELTAVLVQPVGLVEANQIWQQFYVRDDAQAAFPGQELGRLFNTFSQLEDILTNVGYVAAAMAGLTIFLAIYSATVAREQMIAVMRGIGAGRGTVLGMVLVEGLLVALFGALLARLFGYGAAWLIADNLATQNSIPVPLRFVSAIEPLLWGLPIGLGLLAALVPGLNTYRMNVVNKLFGN